MKNTKLKAKTQKTAGGNEEDSYLVDEDRVEVVHASRPSKNMMVRDIGPTIKIEDSFEDEPEMDEGDAVESFTVHQLTPEDMPQVEPLSNVESSPVDFKVDHLDERPAKALSTVQRDEDAAIEAVADKIMQEVIPKDTVRVKFVKFVNLVTSRDFKDVVLQNSNEEIVMSSNLLTELAGAQDRVEERKMPLVFLVGIAIGVVLTYIFFST